MPHTSRPHFKKHPSNANNSSQPRSDIELTTDETPVGLYDLPPDNVRSREHASGRRQSRSTERNLQYRAERASQERTRRKSNDTRARNRSLRADNTSPEREAPAPGQRGRSRAVHPTSLSASPEPTANEHTQALDNTQYTYKYETLTHEGLIQYAKDQLNLDVEGCNTHTILQLLQHAEAEQTPQVGSSLRSPSIVMLPPTPIGVGGGWSQKVVSGKRRGSQVSIPSNEDGAAKLRRKVTVEEVEDVDAPKPHGKVVPGNKIMMEEDTATESETDDEPSRATNSSARLAAENLIAGCDASSTRLDEEPRPPRRGTQAPHPTRDNTPATIIESQPSNVSSHSLGGSSSQCQPDSHPQDIAIPPELAEKLIEWSSQPLRGPSHSRLRSEIILRYLADALRRSDTANAQPTNAGAEFDLESDSSERATHSSSPRFPHSLPSSRLDTSAAEPAGTTTDVDEVPETEFGTASNTSEHATRSSARTYARSRSHQSQSLPSPVPPVVETTDANNAALPRPNSPSLTPAELIRRERARAATDLTLRRSHLATTNTALPTTRHQPRPPLGSRGNAIGRGAGGTRRMDPASAARSNLNAFNRGVAQGQATSLAGSAVQQDNRAVHHSAPSPYAAEELLEDEEETNARPKAYRKTPWKLRDSRVRKPKPLARDVSGIDRQILTMAKIHLFAYALVHGIYQTRSKYLEWASDVHEATSQVELPDQAYNRPPHEIYEIMVNSIATRRGKAKEILREFVARVSGFCQNLKKHEVIQRNMDIFNQLYPNSFHCLSANPRQGDYEHPEIGHCIALIIFHGPNSVGVLYPEYFQEMPLAAVAFCLAIWQFCLEEWANGWRQNGDLGAGAMREKYEAHLAGLNELRRVAPRRMRRLQNEWREYVINYSGALLDPADQQTTDFVGPPLMRPDTPDPDAISVEELNDRLFETARQESIRDRLARIAAEELTAPMDVDDCSSTRSSAPPSRASTPPSRAPSPLPAELNEHGILTARSKGKNRAK
ncbi:Formin-like protein 20 [Rhizoctonia solani]|uniref:Formin-like protein 20 n=1 Tax=Rhizoctonia solani TaxID=456999 RepID=A0A0K6G800_9AGAM|nr:Formin-like protein 20 [Rhizoctonia solani]